MRYAVSVLVIKHIRMKRDPTVKVKSRNPAWADNADANKFGLKKPGACDWLVDWAWDNDITPVIG